MDNRRHAIADKSTATMRVPLFKPDLPAFEAIEGDFRSILTSGRLSNFGECVGRFEAAASTYLSAHVATTSSGTSGLVLALGALGLEPGQRVVVPSFTFIATAQAILYAGGRPLFAEIGDDLTLSPADLEHLLAKYEVGAILPVHIHGLPCQVDTIEHVAAAAARRQGHSIPVLYDAAHAFGTSVDGRRVGTFGTAEVFSLSGTKIVTSVEGGLIASRDEQLIARVRAMRNYGMGAPYQALMRGLNGKMSEIHAAVGLHSLDRIAWALSERQRKARFYLDAIRDHTSFQTIGWPDGVIHTWKDMTVLVPPSLAARRDQVVACLHEQGVETRTYFHPPVHQQPYFQEYADRALPHTDASAARVITIPFYTNISQEEIEYVVGALRVAEQRLG
jgi:dTDP-4-amino-4,6-dideoxygalactose transaminase